MHYMVNYVWPCMCDHACLSVCLPACLSVCMYVCMHVCVYICVYVCVYVCILYVCVCTCMHACMSVTMHVCMYACMFVCINSISTLTTRNYIKDVWRPTGKHSSSEAWGLGKRRAHRWGRGPQDSRNIIENSWYVLFPILKSRRLRSTS